MWLCLRYSRECLSRDEDRLVQTQFISCVSEDLYVTQYHLISLLLPKDPRLETTTYIGPEFTGKAKWYGGLLMADGCIVSTHHDNCC